MIVSDETLAGTPFALASVPTLPAVVDAYATAYPDRPLLVTRDRVLTASQFADASRSLGGALRALNLPRGSAVGLLMPNGWRLTVAMLALNYAGLVAVPLSTWYKSSELRTARRKAKLRAIIAEEEFFGTDYGKILNSAELVEPIESEGWLGSYFWRDGELPENLEAAPPLTADESGQVTPGDVAMYVFTSGSSAEPKVVVITHEGVVMNPFEMGRRWQLTQDDRIWFAAPMFFGYGCVNALPVALTHGIPLYLEERFEPMKSAAFIESNRCTVYYGLGPMTRALLASGAADVHDLSSLRTGPIGISPEDKRLAVEVLGVTGASSIYGLTETYGNCTVTEPGDPLDVVLNTQGTVNQTFRIRCIDPESGAEQISGDPSALGEIQLTGCVTPGYLDDPIANAAAFTEDGWFRTGDLGWIDNHGRLHFSGRLKEVLKIKGITISPAEIEDFVMSHPMVEEAYAFGWTVGDTGEQTLCCGVVLRADAPINPDAAKEQIRVWLKERISSYKVPEIFVVMPPGGVPLTGTGKVSKRLIGEQFIRPNAPLKQSQ